MNFVQMRAFTAVARTGSVTAAAQELGVSRSAVTQQIKGLEDALGVRLFHRKGNALEISDVGRRFLEPAGVMARLLDEIEALAQRTTSSNEGELRIGACAPFMLIPIIAEFTRHFPGVKTLTEMDNSENLANKVREHQLDLAIATLQVPPPEFHSVQLASQTVRAVVPVDHPWATRGSVSIEDLGKEPCVMRERGSMTRRILEDAAAERKVTLDTRFEFGSREAVKEAVAGGLGVGFILDREIGRDPALAYVEISNASLVAGEYLYCHQDLTDIALIKTFFEIARKIWQDTTSPVSSNAQEPGGTN